MRPETSGFERAADAYERGRPGYPAESVAFIVETAHLGPGMTVLDVAAGTGKLTVELVTSGAEVVALEPLEEMRRRLVARLPAVRVIEGVAEETGLPDGSVDAVTAAQAFHWFATDEALAEFARILRRDGLLFLVWNMRDLSDQTQSAVSELTRPFVGAVPSYGSGRWREVIETSPRFVAVGEHHCRSTQRLDRAGLVDRVASTSYIANLPDGTRAELLDKVGRLVPPGELVELRYDTASYCYRRRG